MRNGRSKPSCHNSKWILKNPVVDIKHKPRTLAVVKGGLCSMMLLAGRMGRNSGNTVLAGRLYLGSAERGLFFRCVCLCPLPDLRLESLQLLPRLESLPGF